MFLLIVFLVQFLAGFGVISRFSVVTHFAQKISLAMLTGFVISSLTVYMLEVCHVPLTPGSVMLSMALEALAINIHVTLFLNNLRSTFTNVRFSIRSYEVVLLASIGYLLFFSIWRTYSMPVTPYDSVVGIDLVARQAVQEGHIVSSLFFRDDFRPFLSTQPYYAPFTMLMQIIFRLAGLPFGQFWLGILTASFAIFAYSKMCERLHPLLSGFFLLLLFSAPELYAYTFLLQTDFSNAVFFSIGMLFTIDLLDSKNRQYLWLGALFMGAACWSRTETIILALAVTPVLILFLEKKPGIQSLKTGLAYLSVCASFTILWNFIFFRFYFPVTPKMHEQISWRGIYSSENSMKIRDGMNFFFFSTDYWGYLTYFFLALIAVNFAVYKKSKHLYPAAWLLLFYICFFIMLHHFTLMNIEYTFRRAVMKFLLLMCLLLSRIPLLAKNDKNARQTAI